LLGYQLDNIELHTCLVGNHNQVFAIGLVKIHVLANIEQSQLFKVDLFEYLEAHDGVAPGISGLYSVKNDDANHLDFIFDQLLSDAHRKVFVVMAHDRGQNLNVLLILRGKIQVYPGPLTVVGIIKQDDLAVVVHDEELLMLDVGTDCSAEVAVVHFHFEVVVHSSLVRCKVILVLLVGHAELLRLNEQDDAAAHEVHHHVLQLRDPVVFIYFIEFDVLILDNLESAS
jgi:hypothetical protein